MMQTVLASNNWHEKIFNGKWIAGAGGAIEVAAKANAAPLGTVGIASADDVAAAAREAKAAQAEWARTPGPLRGDVMRRFSALILEHGAEISAQIVAETGSIGPKGQWEVEMGARESLEAAAMGSAPLGVLNATAQTGRRSYSVRVPVGVIGIITPWNSPFLLAIRALAPALVAGNAVLLKPDPQTPICGGVVFAELLTEAGLPPGLFHVLPGAVPTGEAIVGDPLVDMVSFTGSTRAGRLIGAKAGEQLKRVSLELGGNNPYVVLPGVDIDAAASAGAWGSFFHQGQICLTVGRHLVHEDIAADYSASLAKHASNLAVGDPTGQVHLGPVINERQAANVDRIIAESVAAGAQVLTGGDRSGLYYQATVLTDVTPAMPVFTEEIFGPVAPITTFSTDEQAVELANDTHYGLSAAVVGPDVRRAERIAERIHAGIVHVNDQPVLHEVYGPIGGVGLSGNGFNHSTLTNADQFSEWKWVTSRDEIPDYPF